MKNNYCFLQSSATFTALPLFLHTSRPFGIQCKSLLNPAATGDRYILNPPQQCLFLADISICQHGLKASKQAVCWHTPWEKINSLCKHWVTTQTLCHVLGAWISSYMGQHRCFVFSVLANPKLLKGRAGRNPWWGAFTESIR